MTPTRLTILNSMAGEDFESSLDQHLAWGIRDLDLRDAVYGHWLKALPLPDAERAAAAIADRDLTVHCLSSSVFFTDIAAGPDVFRGAHSQMLDHIIELARIFRPRMVRLIAAQLSTREDGPTAVSWVKQNAPWVFDVYKEAIDRIAAAGFTTTIENEAKRCVLSHPTEFVEFFQALDRTGAVTLTWDVQNQWATGVYPEVEHLDALAPLMAYYHVKGGRHVDDSRRLAWNVALADATWPIKEITQRVVDANLSPVICINPAQHGDDDPDYDYTGIVKRDIDFLRTEIDGIA
jgi:hypothetical protein